MTRILPAVLPVMAAAALWGAAAVRLPVGLDRSSANPPGNPASSAKIALGRQLFHDRRLSRDGSLSCADCHDPRRAFTDGRKVARGIGRADGERNVPTLVNRAWGLTYFWDGRAATLEDQVQQPVFNPRELGSSPQAVMKLLRSPSYRAAFRAVFGGEPALEQMSLALACYIRTIVSGESPYDRFEAGDRSALSPSAIRGLFLFRLLGGCSACHNGPNLTDEEFHNTGVAWRTGSPSDEGRARVTHTAEHSGAFKTPTLREISRTGPYMHDGSFATLEDVIEYYDQGGKPNPGLDSRIHPLHLSQEQKNDLLAFLMSLAGTTGEGE